MLRLFTAVTLCLLTLWGLINPLDAAESKPLNVLFIAADDLRCDLGCYGDPLVKSPHLDALAAEGLRFNRAYCQQAVCNPSRASLLTGRRPDTLQLYNLVKHFRDELPNVVTLPEHFKNNGYFTQNIGKVFHNWRTETQGDPQSWSVPAVMHYNRHGEDTAKVEGEVPADQAPHPRTFARDVPDAAYFDGRIADLAVEAIEERQQAEKPFFLAVGFWKPHLPFNAPLDYWQQYQRSQFSLPLNPEPPENVPPLALHDSRELFRSSNGQPPTDQETLELRHGYFAAITYMDRQVGKVLAALEEAGLRDNTIIVFWSDHGFHLGEHSLWCKTSNFELDARVPLIIAPPNYQHAGQSTDSLTELLDIYPTLVDLCDLPKVSGLEGTSLVPVLKNPELSSKDYALTQHPRPAYYKGQPDSMGYSLRTDHYRYTEWRDWESGKVVAQELYNHQTDPGENHNVAAKHPGLVKTLSQKLSAEFGLKSAP
ncbi:MAG: sulfatase [Planctomycetaceae bacterium]|nr:sulfatase [Planctomycetaceae bacterium]